MAIALPFRYHPQGSDHQRFPQYHVSADSALSASRTVWELGIQHILLDIRQAYTYPLLARRLTASHEYARWSARHPGGIAASMAAQSLFLTNLRSLYLLVAVSCAKNDKGDQTGRSFNSAQRGTGSVRQEPRTSIHVRWLYWNSSRSSPGIPRSEVR
jgi:hypothetical protein